MDAYQGQTILCKCGADAVTFNKPIINAPITSEDFGVDGKLNDANEYVCASCDRVLAKQTSQNTWTILDDKGQWRT